MSPHLREQAGLQTSRSDHEKSQKELIAMRVPTIAPPPLPPGHARAVEVLRDLRAADTSWAAPRRRPAPPAPRVDHFARALASTRTVRRLAAVYDALADETEAMLAELAELAPFAAQVQKAGA